MAAVVLIVLSKQVRSKPSGASMLKSRQLILRPNNLCPNKLSVLLTTVAIEFSSPFIACHTQQEFLTLSYIHILSKLFIQTSAECEKSELKQRDHLKRQNNLDQKICFFRDLVIFILNRKHKSCNSTFQKAFLLL